MKYEGSKSTGCMAFIYLIYTSYIGTIKLHNSVPCRQHAQRKHIEKNQKKLLAKDVCLSVLNFAALHRIKSVNRYHFTCIPEAFFEQTYYGKHVGIN